MKKVLCFVTILLLVLSMAACGDDSSGVKDSMQEVMLVGEWSDLLYPSTYHFYEDGTYDVYFAPGGKVIQRSGKYELNGAVLKMCDDDGVMVPFNLSVSENKGFKEIHVYNGDPENGTNKQYLFVKTDDVDRIFDDLTLTGEWTSEYKREEYNNDLDIWEIIHDENCVVFKEDDTFSMDYQDNHITGTYTFEATVQKESGDKGSVLTPEGIVTLTPEGKEWLGLASIQFKVFLEMDDYYLELDDVKWIEQSEIEFEGLFIRKN